MPKKRCAFLSKLLDKDTVADETKLIKSQKIIINQGKYD